MAGKESERSIAVWRISTLFPAEVTGVTHKPSGGPAMDRSQHNGRRKILGILCFVTMVFITIGAWRHSARPAAQGDSALFAILAIIGGGGLILGGQFIAMRWIVQQHWKEHQLP